MHQGWRYSSKLMNSYSTTTGEINETKQRTGNINNRSHTHHPQAKSAALGDNRRGTHKFVLPRDYSVSRAQRELNGRKYGYKPGGYQEGHKDHVGIGDGGGTKGLAKSHSRQRET